MPEAAPLRIAVITPYHKESEAMLRECHDSVTAQSYPATHYMVADGHARETVSSWPVEHIILPRAHEDSGNTPRAIGALSAINRDFDAIAYLDADNWFRPEHIASMVALHLARGAAICTCERTLHRFDGSLLGDDVQSDGVNFADTNCLFLARPAFRLVPLWALMPKGLGRIGDRIFWHAVVASSLPRAHLQVRTVAYRTRYADHYLSRGEAPPPGAIADEEVNQPWRWWMSQPPEFRAYWERYFRNGGW